MNTTPRRVRRVLRPLALAAMLGLSLGALPAVAQSPAPKAERAQQAQAQLEQRFKRADANGDGLLTKDEAKDPMPRVYAHFEQIDVDKKGAVTLDQIKQYGAQQLAQRKAAR